MTRSAKQGFTAVELLIALAVAVLFLIAGKQLFMAVSATAGEARVRGNANNLAYSILREYQTKAQNPCAAMPSAQPVDAILLQGYDLSNASATYQITCPYSIGNNRLSLLTVAVTFSNPKKETVTHAIIVGT